MATISSTRQRASGSSARRAAVAYHFGGCARAKKNLARSLIRFNFFLATNKYTDTRKRAFKVQRSKVEECKHEIVKKIN
jgi:hypothetical protein